MSEPSRLSTLITGCLARLRAFVARRTAASEVDDVVQETIANLVAADQIAQINQVSAWLFRAARNELIDRSRKIKESPLPDWDEGDFELAEISEVMCSPPIEPEDALLRIVFWEELAAALDDMPGNQREIFIKTELEGMSFKEISEATGVGVNTLLARKRRATLKLKERLKDVYQLVMEP